ncbi:hypothetical protein KDA_31950 [Dictyobacter alpinus]|uniref:Uncharacterized protein n=1 Tax=Dictyobacter alpinus TaxID=2014873 RepID=A0A402B8L5_9CHLR|nr:hypothetical protein [Dictyobacter alpinus]GCE27711.1 hypothetical protein KDA_31950 [Dictyobacter alpinus]
MKRTPGQLVATALIIFFLGVLMLILSASGNSFFVDVAFIFFCGALLLAIYAWRVKKVFNKDSLLKSIVSD